MIVGIAKYTILKICRVSCAIHFQSLLNKFSEQSKKATAWIDNAILINTVISRFYAQLTKYHGQVAI